MAPSLQSPSHVFTAMKRPNTMEMRGQVASNPSSNPLNPLKAEVKRDQRDREQEETMEGLERNISALYTGNKTLRNLTIGVVAFIILFNILLLIVGVVVVGMSYLINQLSKYAPIWQNSQVFLLLILI
jgi:hypothetical protein